MTSNTDRFPFTAHCRASGLTIPGVPSAPGGTATGRTLRQGEEFTVTAELWAETVDRNGNSFLSLTAEEQVKRWGMVKFAEGPAPEGLGIGMDDEHVLTQRGIAALDYAKKISDPRERAQALAKVNAEYGQYLIHVVPDAR